MAKKKTGRVLRALRMASLPAFVGSIAAFVLLAAVAVTKTETFNAEISSHIHMAAHAPTIEDAQKDLDIAISRARKRKLTDGSTSIFIDSPRNSVLIWYLRLRVVQQQLRDASEFGVTTEEREIILNRMRRTILRMAGGSSVTYCPDGISRYPYNAAYLISVILLLLLFVASWIIHVGKPYTQERW